MIQLCPNCGETLAHVTDHPGTVTCGVCDHSYIPRAEYQDAAFAMLAALRGGVPERCDFCEEPYTDARRPIPEEAGMWACSECYARWRVTDPAYRNL